MSERFARAVVELENSLSEWKDAGGSSINVVGAIQEFVYAINDDAYKILGLIKDEQDE